MSRPGALASHQLPGAVVILALSIATLAAVLAGMECGRERRAKDRRKSPNNTFASAAVTHRDDDGHDIHSSAATMGADRNLAAAAATTAAANGNGTGTRVREGLLLARGGSSCCSCRYCAVGMGERLRGGAEEEDTLAPNPSRTNVSQPSFATANSNNRNLEVEMCSSSGHDHRDGHRGEAAVVRASTPCSAAAALNADSNCERVGLAGGSPPLAPLHPDVLFSSPAFVERSLAEATVNTAAQAAEQSVPSGGKRLELLVHNISHKDMVLSLRRTRLGVRRRLRGEAVSAIDAVRVVCYFFTVGRRIFALV